MRGEGVQLNGLLLFFSMKYFNGLSHWRRQPTVLITFYPPRWYTFYDGSYIGFPTCMIFSIVNAGIIWVFLRYTISISDKSDFFIRYSDTRIRGVTGWKPYYTIVRVLEDAQRGWGLVGAPLLISLWKMPLSCSSKMIGFLFYQLL